MPRRPGQTKRTPEVDARIQQALELGAPHCHAAAYGGISDDTFKRWLDRDADFADLVKKAEARAVVGWLAKIEKAANEGNWTAAAWKLERRYPEQFGRQIIEHQVRRVQEEAERLAKERGLDPQRVWTTMQELAGRAN